MSGDAGNPARGPRLTWLGRGGRLAGAWNGGPFAVRDFRLLSLGQLTSTVGDFCYAVALPWFILSSHGGTVLLGVVLACYGVPRTVLIPVGGMLADRVGPRTVMLIADAVRCVLVALLAVVAARHTVSLALLGPLAALLGAGEGSFIPASYSIMPTILRSEQLTAGNSLSTAMVQVGMLAGPVLGGLLVAIAGSAPAFAVDAVSFALSAAALAMISARRTPVAASQDDAADDTQTSAVPGPGAGHGPADQHEPGVPAGPAAKPLTVWSLLRHSRLFQIILGFCVVANLTSGGTFEVALPALTYARFGVAGHRAAAYGVLIACSGAGAVIGILAASKGGALRRPAVIAFCAYLVEALFLGALPYLGGFAGAATAIFIFSLCNGFGNIVVITLLQRWAPSQLLGRVMSLVMLAAIGTFPASVAVTGVLVRHIGPTPFFPVAGIVLFVTILAGLTQKVIRDFGAAEPGPTALSTEPA
jgi:predicted MFS family arabinose efflux permease